MSDLTLREQFENEMNQPGTVFGMPDYIKWLEAKFTSSEEKIDYGVWHDFKKEKPPYNDPYMIVLDGLPRCALWVEDGFQEGNFMTPLVFKPELITHWAYYPPPPPEFAKK